MDQQLSGRLGPAAPPGAALLSGLNDLLGDLPELDVPALGELPQQVERSGRADVVAFHENALRLAEEGAGLYRGAEMLVGLRAPKRDGCTGGEDQGLAVVLGGARLLGVHVQRPEGLLSSGQVDRQAAAETRLVDDPAGPPG